MSLAGIAGVIVAAVALAALHYAFWSWRLGVATGEDEVVPARTRDGWTLFLARRRPAVRRGARPSSSSTGSR